MYYYFFDWEIRNINGVQVKWANTISEAEEDVPPTEVFTRARAELRTDMGLDEEWSVRAITFSKI